MRARTRTLARSKHSHGRTIDSQLDYVRRSADTRRPPPPQNFKALRGSRGCAPRTRTSEFLLARRRTLLELLIAHGNELDRVGNR